MAARRTSGPWDVPSLRWPPASRPGRNSAHRCATQSNAMQRNATQCNAMQCAAMQRNAMEGTIACGRSIYRALYEYAVSMYRGVYLACQSHHTPCMHCRRPRSLSPLSCCLGMHRRFRRCSTLQAPRHRRRFRSIYHPRPRTFCSCAATGYVVITTCNKTIPKPHVADRH